MKKYVDDILFVVGCALIVGGVAQYSKEIALIVAGLFFILGSFMVGSKGKP